jgi:hypothetical protein
MVGDAWPVAATESRDKLLLSPYDNGSEEIAGAIGADAVLGMTAASCPHAARLMIQRTDPSRTPR